MDPTKLAIIHAGSDHYRRLPGYELKDRYYGPKCGPCYFREGFITELPGRMTIKEFSGLFGAPAIDPQLWAHITTSYGLIPPEPGEHLEQFRRRREKDFESKPVKKLHPTLAALWKLMGFQPPLAITVLRFCQGQNEQQIAESLGISVWNAQVRLSKGTRIALKWT